MISFRKNIPNAPMLVLQTPEHFHVCSPDNVCATLPGADDLFRFAMDHHCNSLIFAKSADLNLLNVQLPAQTAETERDEALRYEAASITNRPLQDIALSVIPRNTLKSSVIHDAVGAVFSLEELGHTAAKFNRKNLFFSGITSVEQLLLLHHFSEESSSATILLFMSQESTFTAIPGESGLSLRNIPFGLRGIAGRESAWVERAGKRLNNLKGEPVTLYVEHADELLYNKVRDILQPAELFMQSFDELLPTLRDAAADSQRLKTARLPLPQKDPRDAGTRLSLLMIGAVLIYSLFNVFVADKELSERSTLLASHEAAAAERTRTEPLLNAYTKESANLEQILNVLNGANPVDPNYRIILNLLSRYPLRYTRTNTVSQVSKTEFLLSGETLFQEELSRFLNHFEQQLRPYKLYLSTEGLEKGSDKLNFKCRIRTTVGGAHG